MHEYWMHTKYQENNISVSLIEITTKTPQLNVLSLVTKKDNMYFLNFPIAPHFSYKLY